MNKEWLLIRQKWIKVLQKQAVKYLEVGLDATPLHSQIATIRKEIARVAEAEEIQRIAELKASGHYRVIEYPDGVMGRPKSCCVCEHEDVERINDALMDGITTRNLEYVFGLSRSSLERHKIRCLGYNVLKKDLSEQHSMGNIDIR